MLKSKNNIFKIYISLNDIKDKLIHDVNLKSYVNDFISSTIQHVNIYIANVRINSIEQLQDLGFYFDEDILLFGGSMNKIASVTTVEDLRDLGLY